MDSTYGLELEYDKPIWAVFASEECVADIAHRHLNLSADEVAQTTTTLKFLGGFNNLYAVECPRGSFFMRLALPVDQHFKTLSEVATISVVRSQTTVPVPDIIASNSSSDNELKSEWILMGRVPGVPLTDVWSELTWDAQISCVRKVAGIMAQLFELRYDSIGNLYNAKDLPIASEGGSRTNAAESNSVVVDRIVSGAFFAKAHLKSSVHRGPFASSEDWLDAILQLTEENLTRISKSEDANEDDIKIAEKARPLLDRLRKQLPSFFHFSDREEFALHHHDIHPRNLISDPTGKLQALVDWECVSVMPLWKVCQMPKLIDVENARLREEFLAEMAQLAPRWIEEHRKSQPKMDFERALLWLLRSDFTKAKRIGAWLDGIEAGEEYREL